MQDSSPLLAAAAAGQGSAVGALLSGGALIDAPDVTGVTAMMAAAAQGHVDCMQILLGFHAGKPCVNTSQGPQGPGGGVGALFHTLVSPIYAMPLHKWHYFFFLFSILPMTVSCIVLSFLGASSLFPAQQVLDSTLIPRMWSVLCQIKCFVDLRQHMITLTATHR